MRFIRLAALLLILVAPQLQAKEYSITTVPNPKGSNSNGFVSNPNGIISADAERAINAMLDSLEHRNGTEAAVVLLESIGHEEIEVFANKLFTHWGLGKKGADNGLLILFVNDQRAITFETGYGIEGILPESYCKNIQLKQMVPYFKIVNYSKGMLEGVKKVAEVLETGVYDYKDSTLSFFERSMLTVREFFENFKPNMRDLFIHNTLLFFALCMWLPIFIVTFIVVAAKMRRIKKTYLHPEDRLQAINALSKKINCLVMLLSPPTFMIACNLQGHVLRLEKIPPHCRKCNHKLDYFVDARKHAFLSPGQLKEETLGSVEYAVWHCPSCDDVNVKYTILSSDYLLCSSCSIRAFKIDTEVLKPATKRSKGLEQVTYHCLFCGKYKKYNNVISREKEEEEEEIFSSSSSSHSSSSSSTSIFGSGSSSSSNSSSSSTSGSSSSSSQSRGSGGGSWGGGRSGGGGATSRW